MQRLRILTGVLLLVLAAGWMTVSAFQPSANAQPPRDEAALTDEQRYLIPSFGSRATEKTARPREKFRKQLRKFSVPLIVKEAESEVETPDGKPTAVTEGQEDYQTLRLLPSIDELRFRLPESVCGTDERLPVPSTLSAPYNGNCLLLISMISGGRARGTGWLIDSQTVITAGHCVHEGDGGNFFTSIEVIPGAYVARVDGIDVLRRPYGSKVVSASRLRASEAWKTNGTMALDYGAVLADSPFGGVSGSPTVHRAAALNDAQLSGLELHLAGYPGDKPTGTQWEGFGPFEVEAQRLRYMVDTAAGQSGSAVHVIQADGSRVVVGIHNYGSCPNRCTRISASVLADLEHWQSESTGGEEPSREVPPTYKAK